MQLSSVSQTPSASRSTVQGVGVGVGGVGVGISVAGVGVGIGVAGVGVAGVGVGVAGPIAEASPGSSAATANNSDTFAENLISRSASRSSSRRAEGSV